MFSLVQRSLVYHWRTNLAVALGVAAAVAVLGGALLVGDSVRGSLRDLVLSRLGRTGHVVSSTGFFREALAADLSASVPAAPLIATTGFVTHEPSGRRAASVLVYGVDERFWRFHGLEPREGVYASPALVAELGAAAGDVLLTRLQKPSEIPLESLYARKEDMARTVRLTLTAALPRESLGEFSLQPQQGDVRAVFAPLRRLQRDLAAAGQVNTVLVQDSADDAAVNAAFQRAVTLDDIGVRVAATDDTLALRVESASGIISAPLEEAARKAGTAAGLPAPLPVFTYLANTIRIRDREVPYSLVTGIDLGALPPSAPSAPRASTAPPSGDAATPLVLNTWAARELDAAVGDPVELEFYLWDANAGLRTSKAPFVVSAIVPMTGLAGDRHLAPEYPGITGAESLADWDPPFPLDLARVRKQDEAYWDTYRATPKAFLPYERARDLWATRYGAVTGLRFANVQPQDVPRLVEAMRKALRDTVSPASQGLVLLPSRRLALDASAGATNFGEYFTYFSFFIVVSAVLLAMLFFRLGVEQRLRQIGILRATGFTTAGIRRLLLTEALLLAAAGSAIGVAGAIGYARLIVHGLRTWWVGAVGTTLLNVHVTTTSLALGAAGGVVAALVCVLLSLRTVARRTPRALLGAQSLEPPPGADGARSRRSSRAGVVAALLGLSLIALGFVSAGTPGGCVLRGRRRAADVVPPLPVVVAPGA